MRICALSDLHGYLPPVPDCDIVLLAGDLCPDRDQLAWLNGPFRKWLESIDAKVFATWGNHDFVGQRTPQTVASLNLPWTLLVDEEAEYKGLRIYGTPWTPLFGYWAFMRPDDELPFEQIPEGIDILISHGPPYMLLDEVYPGEHVGSKKLFDRMLRVRPKLTVFGHIHETRGEKSFDDMYLANVTVVNELYELRYPAWEFEL